MMKTIAPRFAVCLLPIAIAMLSYSISNAQSAQVNIQSDGTKQFKVIGYLPSWAGSVNDVQFSKLTHVNYAFVLPTATGGLKPIGNGAKLKNLVLMGHAAKVKVMVAIGGWNDGNDSDFESLAANADYRDNFTNSIVKLIKDYDLDGVDIDWEYPDKGASADNFSLLMQQLSTTLHKMDKLLSAAVVSDNGTSIKSDVFGYVDYLNLMAYDGGGPHHSTYSFAEKSLNYWKGRGLPAAKANLGVPFYGRSPNSYVDFKDILKQGGKADLDTLGKLGYNGIATIKSKTSLAFEHGGGIMIWDLNADAPGSNSLLTAINETVTSFKK